MLKVTAPLTLSLTVGNNASGGPDDDMVNEHGKIKSECAGESVGHRRGNYYR